MKPDPKSSGCCCCGRLGRFLFVVLAIAGVYLLIRFNRDKPVVYASAVEQFKYGSTGGERDAGIPVALWKILPDLFQKYLPGKGLASVGFLYETNREFPIGVSQRNVQGVDRVFLNCAVCHAGTVRDTPGSPPRVIVGMPANGMDLQAFERFLFACARDEDFNPSRLVDEIAQRKGDDWLNRALFRYLAVDIARQRLITLAQRFSFMDREPDAGPGRVDTFNSPKVLLNFPMENLPENEWVGNCDFPSIWNQAKRQGMQLHWDGNNDSVEERNRSAAFGTGATPPTIDRHSVNRMKEFTLTNTPPPWPYEIDPAKTGRGEKLYVEYCARCHGRSGSDFTGELVGQVTPIENIKTDRHRLDSYTEELCANQNLLYAAYPEERFKHFRKTFGYANQPLDGLWLRGPYLHNGAVPTLRELLEPAAKRRPEFYRGYDVIDRERVGFISDVPREIGGVEAPEPAASIISRGVPSEIGGAEALEPAASIISRGGPSEIGGAETLEPAASIISRGGPSEIGGAEALEPAAGIISRGGPEEKGRKYFKYDTRLPGNGNYGHEGEEYGTNLGAEEKDALVEYLKTF